MRPEFTGTLAIEGGRHPIMDVAFKDPVIPNDTFASLSSSFQIITGPNMSGKSTYIKQVALLVIMAQIGSFIPAKYASVRLCSQVKQKKLFQALVVSALEHLIISSLQDSLSSHK